MAFQSGHRLNQREKLFFDALMLEMKEAPDLRGMRPIARKLLDLAVSGDIQAIKEVGNRIDGMPVQQIDQTISQTRTVIRAPAPDASGGQWATNYTPQKQKPLQ